MTRSRSRLAARPVLASATLALLVLGGGIAGSHTAVAATAPNQRTATFAPTDDGSRVAWTVPAGVTFVTVTATGASGTYFHDFSEPDVTTGGGLGALVTATVPVTPGEVLWVGVGAQNADPGGSPGGAGGSSESSEYQYQGNAGGGGTFLTDARGAYIVVAGGGGGQGGATEPTYGDGYCRGGAGGNADEAGQRGPCESSSGGAAGDSATIGGGAGESGHNSNHSSGAGGGGGGGALGGESGHTWDFQTGGGGAGGSSLIVAPAVGTISHVRAYGDGGVVIAYDAVPTTLTVGPSALARASGINSVVDAAVVDGDGVPVAGSVTLRAADGTAIDTAVLDATGAAQLTVPSSTPGQQALTVGFVPSDAVHAYASADLAVTTSKATTTATVTALPTAPVVGESTTLTASVAADVGTLGVPTGTVTFSDGSTALGTAMLNSTGTATFAVVLAAGSHSVVTVYGGDTLFAAATSEPLGIDTSLDTSAVTLTQTGTTPTAGGAVTLAAAVAVVAPGASTPGGTVQFTLDGADLGAPVAVAAASAGLVTGGLPAGQHSFVAVYSGDASVNPSTSTALVVTVPKAVTTLELAGPAGIVETRAATFEATVDVVASPLPPTGTVQFAVDGVAVGAPAAVDSRGIARLVSDDLAVGTRHVTAVFAATSDLLGSQDAAQTVVVSRTAATVAITITSSALSVKRDGSVVIAVTGTDANGVSLGDLSSLATVTSSVATDVVVGTTVTFPHASPHVLTVTVGSATAAVLIEVIPPGARLAATGFDAWPTVGAALAALLLGAVMYLRGRRRSRV